MKDSNKKMEFSKKILIVAAIINIAVIAFTCFMVWITKDISPLIYLIPSVAAEAATGTGFYYWKARLENSIKLRKEYGLTNEEMTEAKIMAEDNSII